MQLSNTAVVAANAWGNAWCLRRGPVPRVCGCALRAWRLADTADCVPTSAGIS
eukprot:m.760322 g.760322  ORF g.760322 m.760322 type:complete len:53 (-) comp23200_c0_seq5:2083-2241(-)